MILKTGKKVQAVNNLGFWTNASIWEVLPAGGDEVAVVAFPGKGKTTNLPLKMADIRRPVRSLRRQMSGK